MQFGHFDDEAREYVIETPATPLPWINYLGNEDFFSLISNTGGGYSFYKDAKLRRITRYRYKLLASSTAFHRHHSTHPVTSTVTASPVLFLTERWLISAAVCSGTNAVSVDSMPW